MPPTPVPLLEPARDDHRELVAIYPRDETLISGKVAKSLRDALYQDVPRLAPQRAVDLLHPLEVDDEQR